MTARRLLLLLILVLLVLSCKYLRPSQKLESEAAIENPSFTRNDSDLYLNGNTVGRISDIGVEWDGINGASPKPLDRILMEIIRQREALGVFEEGTNQTQKRVQIHLETDFSVAAFARLYVGVQSAGGSPKIPRIREGQEDLLPIESPRPGIDFVTTNGEKNVDRKPDPLQLHVRTFSGRFYPHEMNSPKLSNNFSIDVEYVAGRDALLSTRAFQNSIEISADERLFANDKHTDDQGPKYTQVRQREISVESLRSEMERIKSSGDSITIIVSDRSSYGKLLSVLETLDAKFLIIVRQSPQL